MMDKLKEYIKHPANVIFYLQNRCNFRVLSDESYLKLNFRLTMGKELNLKNPQTYMEKLQWLKIYDRNPEYTRMVDKFEAKNFVAEKVGEQYIIPTLGVWEHFDDIDFDSLPDQFVLKCTHDSGSILVVKDKKALDIPAAKKMFEKHLKQNYYYSGREWPYKDVQPRIIAEQYLTTSGGLNDYKFYCFGGKVKLLLVVQGRSTGNLTGDVFDENGNPLEVELGFTPAASRPVLPEAFEEMKRLAEILSAGIPQLRVDFYVVDENVYFGELTFFCGSGTYQIRPEEWDLKLGAMIDLPTTKQ